MTVLQYVLVPFSLVIEWLFRFFLALTKSPGMSIICLSASLSLLLFPLYAGIERLKESQRQQVSRMQEAIDEITAVYHGRERYYYLREIYRQHGYSHWSGLLPSVGLLIQIPFLLAAYHYLSDFSGFTGHSFLYISDLSQPDTVARVAGQPLNVLPIVMTIINLYSGYLYSRHGKISEKLSFASVALVFLVLLYQVASAVVLYWTFSNIFALLRMQIIGVDKTSRRAMPN